ncbi:50S ribosomal protein L29 [Patescibacteria group bacterium]|nr:50S ribosomal protein L29 [Patescibacteria group bacterium]MBU1890339.1 50S ribosomal protein L29 [Patescibacteria group bacterium]
MKIEELRAKPAKELNILLQELREKERDLRFKISAKQMKNVRELRDIKKTIAKIFTVLNSKQSKPSNTKP